MKIFFFSFGVAKIKNVFKLSLENRKNQEYFKNV